MQNDFSVGGRLHHRAVAYQRASQRQSIGEIAVVSDGEAAGIEFGEQRLDVAQDGFAGGGITHMADGGVAGQAGDDVGAGEGVADEAEAAFGMKTIAVEGDDAGGFLATMLKGVKAERSNRGGIGVAENAEHAALFAQRVAVQIQIKIAFQVGVGRFMAGVNRRFHVVHHASIVHGISVPQPYLQESCLQLIV